MHHCADALSGLPTSGEDKTPLEVDLRLLAIDTIHNLDDTQISVIHATKDDVLQLKNDNTEESINKLPTEIEFLMKQAQSFYDKSATLQIRRCGSKLFFGNRGALTSKSNADKTTQAVVSESLCSRILYLSHHLPISGHSYQLSMYKKHRKIYYWTHIPQAFYITAAQCTICA